MAKRGYKLQEFVAHSTNVNCLSIGKKASRLFITGGDDHIVNLWAIGQPNSLMSLCGHTSPVEAVAFDTSEVLVLGGASTGAIKLWDLEEAKVLRTLTGHKSNCSAAEFHPFGEFFASGSLDANLKIWDIRKKGCIHTYKGHTRGISTIRFTPDGRWVVSGGLDNVVKVWDLTAGKLLHDFKFHEGHIRSIDFHPLEFLLATGSADRTVKFWDLETFELIGSTRPEATGVRSIAFHPDGRTLFCGLDDSLKVYSWEPVICHDAVDMGWSTLGDLCIHEEKLLGCSYYRNSVGVWVADISLIEPYGAAILPEKSDCTEQEFSIPRSPSDKVGNGVKSASNLRSRSPDYETKEIKNIYIDSSGGNPVASRRPSSLSSPKVVLPLNSKEMNKTLPLPDKPSLIEVDSKSSGRALNKSFIVPNVVPRESLLEKDSGRETITFSKTKPGMLLRPAHVRRPSNSKNDVEKLSVTLESGTFNSVASDKERVTDLILETRIISEDLAKKSSELKSSDIKSVPEKFEKVVPPEKPSNPENCDKPINGSKGTASVKIVNGVAVVAGRTRTLVEKFERREKLGNEETNMIPQVVLETSKTPLAIDVTSHVMPETKRLPTEATKMTPQVVPEIEKTPVLTTNRCDIPDMEKISSTASIRTPMIPEMERTSSTTSARTPPTMPEMERTPSTTSARTPPTMLEMERTPSTTSMRTPPVISEMERTPSTVSTRFPRTIPETERILSTTSNRSPPKIPEMERTRSTVSTRFPRTIPETERRLSTASTRNRPMIYGRDRTSSRATNATSRVIPETDRTSFTAVNMASRIIRETTDRTPPTQREEPQTSGRDSSSANCMEVTEDLMQTHDVFLSTLKSRLTKLQVIRHFWERNDMKGAIDAMRRLPDQSVQADVISVLMEKMEILTLDLFSCLLPVLVGLLESKMERHANVSLEMLLKLVAVFGPRIRSAISAPRSVGVDLHQEQRLECYNQCFIQLQMVRQILPAIIRKGGLLAKCARELNLVLQDS